MTQDSNLLRYPDGTWGFGLPNGPLTFANGDEALAYFYDLFHRVGANERDMAKLEASKGPNPNVVMMDFVEISLETGR